MAGGVAGFKLSLVVLAVDRATAPMRRATKNFEAMRKGIERGQKAFRKAADLRQAGEAVSAVSRKMTSAALGPIEAWEEFEEKIAELGAKVTGATAANMMGLEEKAMLLGKTIGEFSPTDAASGMIGFAKSAYTTKEILDAIPHALNLSTAAGVDLAQTTEILTGAMAPFGWEAAKTEEAADILAAAANNAKTDLSRLSEAFSYVAPNAATAGLSFQQTATLAGALANANIDASRAGTNLTGILQRLAGARRGPGAKIIKELIGDIENFTDAAGELQVLDIMAALGKKLEGLSKPRQLQAMGVIFRDQAAAASVLAGALAKPKTETLKLAVANAHADRYTQKTAETMRKTGANETKQLTSAIETLNIELGKMMKDYVRPLKFAVMDFVAGISAWAKEHPGLTKVILVTTGVLAVLATILAACIFTLAGVTSAIGVLSISFGTAKTGVQLLIAAVRWMALRLASLAVTIWMSVIPPLKAWVLTIWTSVITSLKAWAVAIWTRVIPALGAMMLKLLATIPVALAAAAPFLAIAVAIGAVTLAIRELVKYWDQLNFDEVMQGISESVEEAGVIDTLKELFDPRTLLRDIGVMERQTIHKKETRSMINLKVTTDPGVTATVASMQSGGADLGVDTGPAGAM